MRFDELALPGEPKLALHEPVEVPERTKPIGRRATDKTGERSGTFFVKEVVRSKHFYRKIGGYCLTDSLINRFESEGIERVFIHEKDTADVVEYHLEDFTEDVDRGVYRSESGQETQSCAPENKAVNVWSDLDDEFYEGGFWEDVDQRR